MQPQAGILGVTLAGRYRIESQLGAGGMATVFLARDLELNGRLVVIKFPDAQQLGDPRFRARFLAEIRSLASLDHPHVLKIHDTGEFEQTPFAVVQYVGGGDLSERLAAGVQSPEDALSWLRVIADALDFVHRHGFCHRDVKPANIFLDEAGYAYLSDFGIATAMQEADPQATQTGDAYLTMAGVFVGSPRYSPPEAAHRKLSPAYDQYSLATTLYEALTSRFPVEGESSDAILFAKYAPPTDIREHLPGLPGGAADAIMRALSIRPEERFESCRAFAGAYEQGLADGAAPPRSSRKQSRRAAPGRVAALGRGALVAAAAAAAALGTWRLANDGAGPVLAAAPGPLLVASLHRFEAGSTPDEFADALQLCRRFDAACDASWFVPETPRATVLAPYRLDLREVSLGEFAGFAGETGYRTTAEERNASYHRFVKIAGLSWREAFEAATSGSDGSSDALRLPVTHVSHADARAYCRHVGARLPTEEEWEFAARGDARRRFAWGDAWDAGRAGWKPGGEGDLAAVDSHPESGTPDGHLHLSGNVAEWTDGRVGDERVIKGGSGQDANPASLRGASRALESPDYSSSDVGFRCAHDPAGEGGGGAAAPSAGRR